jgi:hypothetical protein
MVHGVQAPCKRSKADSLEQVSTQYDGIPRSVQPHVEG